ncbi:MAG TPA: dihydrolipoamide acetyltransferase family protein [Planctomycetota bacterium]|nr:dihydrolipoamide acetyltransferase family protein [Planctomycetota bacterium]
MPKLGQTMEEGTIEKWLKKEGDTVTKGEPLFEVTTDKATLEVEAFVSGTLLKVLVNEGETVPVNEVIAFVGEKGEAVPETVPSRGGLPESARESPAQPREAKAAGAPAAKAAAAPRPAAARAVTPPEQIKASPRARKLAEAEKVPMGILRGSGPEGRIIEEDVERYLQTIRNLKVSPVARELAWQNSVDLTQVKGSGADGRIMKEDVETAAQAPVAAAGAMEVRREELTAMRKVVGQRMTLSKTTVPHFYLTMDVDMGRAMAFRKDLNAKSNAKVSFNDLIIKACGDAMNEMPRANASFRDDHIELKTRVDISLAVALEGGGLMVPVVRDVQNKDYLQVWKDTQDLIQKARSKHLTPDDYEGGCMTISNLGMMDIDSFTPIINPGQSCILGIGRIQEKAVVRDGGIHVRPMMNVTLAADHRVMDGAEGGKFLAAIKKALEELGEEEVKR